MASKISEFSSRVRIARINRLVKEFLDRAFEDPEGLDDSSASEKISALFVMSDIHVETAAQVLGVPVEQVTPQQRYAGKVQNFMELYGGGKLETRGDYQEWARAHPRPFVNGVVVRIPLVPKYAVFMDVKTATSNWYMECVCTVIGDRIRGSVSTGSFMFAVDEYGVDDAGVDYHVHYNLTTEIAGMSKREFKRVFGLHLEDCFSAIRARASFTIKNSVR